MAPAKANSAPAKANHQAQVLTKAKRVVVKVGSSLLVDSETGHLKRAWMEALAADMAQLRKRGQDIVLVSSGAIALGRRLLKLAPGALKLEESQAAAAAGQIRLAHAWAEILGTHDMPVAQVLLTLGDSEDRRQYLNARATLSTLLKLGAVPVINENDTVATAEIRFGDNDRLGARVAQMVSADCLLLLSDIDGLYTADPGTDPDARFIETVRAITPEIEAMGGESRSGLGRGGMVTKIEAGRIALAAGCAMVISSGKIQHPIRAIEKGGRATFFVPGDNPATARKQWISGSMKPMGTITIDAGAAAALARGKSLLPAGVTEVEGAFQRGDPVIVRGPDGREVARGLIAYSTEDARRIMGHKSREISERLGYRGRDEMIHRDDLVLR